MTGNEADPESDDQEREEQRKVAHALHSSAGSGRYTARASHTHSEEVITEATDWHGVSSRAGSMLGRPASRRAARSRHPFLDGAQGSNEASSVGRTT